MNKHNEHIEQQGSQELQIQVPPDVQRGVYANQMYIAHTEEEFILDFILASPPTGIVNSRVIISPSHAKRLLAVLQESIVNYESRFQEIKQITPSTPDSIMKH